MGESGRSIITGREELGFAKIYAEMPPPVALGNRYMATASWEGFRFFHIEAFDLEEAPTDPDQPSGLFHYKFIPKTASLGDADVSYLEYAPPNQLATGNGGLVTTRRMSGNGRFAFHRARWEDVPFQYPIINALNELPLLEVRSAGVTWHAARATIGNPSAGVLAAID